MRRSQQERAAGLGEYGLGASQHRGHGGETEAAEYAADGVCLVASHAARQGIRHIVELADGGCYHLADLGIDGRMIIDDPGHRAYTDLGEPRDVTNGWFARAWIVRAAAPPL